ncbi:GlsB/YeaQ/YmgE family stress response membrane protein [Xylophilus sp. Kf1]|nr:GlsB/YeaQ/YmgE family stress response membrane protein [Xylophilus sp. Kf1]
MDIVWTILIGFVAGLAARALMPGRDALGFLLTAVLGILGSVLVTYLGQALGWYQAAQGAGFIASVAGALVLLGIGRLVRNSMGGISKT